MLTPGERRRGAARGSGWVLGRVWGSSAFLRHCVRASVPALLCVALGTIDAVMAGSADTGAGAPMRVQSVAHANENNSLSPLVGWTDHTCGSCHRMQEVFSHPVDVTPSMQVPAHLPLVSGRITCITCHDNRDAQLHVQARQKHDGLLRPVQNAASFCTQCHSAGDSSRIASHASMLDKAHLRLPDRGHTTRGPAASGFRAFGGPAAGTSWAGLNLDAQSRACFTCHDGAMTGDLGGYGLGVSNPGQGHPIGVRYAPGNTSRPDIRLVSAAVLDSRIHLVDNIVGCTTCHSPYSTLPNQLVMSNARSALCVSCHRQE